MTSICLKGLFEMNSVIIVKNLYSSNSSFNSKSILKDAVDEQNSF